MNNPQSERLPLETEDLESEEYNLEEGIREKRKGVAIVANNNGEFLEEARAIAQRFAIRNGQVTVDDVRSLNYIVPLHHNAWGALFKSSEWEWTGDYVPSSKVSNHAHIIRVWRLKQRYLEEILEALKEEESISQSPALLSTQELDLEGEKNDE